MPGKEISTTNIVLQAFQDGKKVYVPYIHSQAGNSKLKVLDMLRLKDEQDLKSLLPDTWGIPSLSEATIHERENALGGFGIAQEPDSSTKQDPLLDLIFVPAMAFDSQNQRLGHGKGFYDRYISRCHDELKIEGRKEPCLGKKESSRVRGGR